MKWLSSVNCQLGPWEGRLFENGDKPFINSEDGNVNDNKDLQVAICGAMFGNHYGKVSANKCLSLNTLPNEHGDVFPSR